MRKFLFILLCIFVLTVINSFTQDIVFFSDSPDSTFFDSSWGYITNPSYLELVGLENNKFPVDTRHHYQGANSLRLHWTSESGGDWGIAVASIGWTGHDLTEYDSISYWINARNSVSHTALPSLELEDMGNMHSTRVWLGDFFDSVDDDSATWQRIVIPIDTFKSGPQNCDFTKIKTIFHYQNASDAVKHIVWLDEIRAIKSGGTTPTVPGKPKNFIVTGHDSRIDLRWDLDTNPNLAGYFIYRSISETGPYTKLNISLHEVHVYSDFIGQNGQTYYYYATAANQNFQESQPSDTLSAATFVMTDDQLLSSVQEAMFRYFYDYGHPVSGLVRERNAFGVRETCTSGGTGFGLMAIVVGAERGFISRDSAAARVHKILDFLQNKTTKYHGAWPHWINGTTGDTKPFSQYDDGGDLVETAYLIQGALTVLEYFDQNNVVENEIRDLATQMWEGVEWDWYRRTATGNFLYWHWSSNHGWAMNMPIVGYNETMIVYLLAIASPTHGVPASLYYDGWMSSTSYANGNSYFGYTQWVGPAYGGPLFFTHYSFLGFDPRDKEDQYCNYFENSRNISLIHREYSIANPLSHVGYDSLVWGLTASDESGGYSAHSPYSNDNGTITPTAAISAMPYTPQESIATLKHFYFTLGPQLWGEFGFKDAFNPGLNWFAQSYLAIDQGPMVIMIENYRTQLCWNLFMSNPEISTMLANIGWTDIGDESDNIIWEYKLSQNYPNPFNPSTIIEFNLATPGNVTLEIFNILGQIIQIPYSNDKLNAGNHKVEFIAHDLPTGVYFYRLSSGSFNEIKKMILIR